MFIKYKIIYINIRKITNQVKNQVKKFETGQKPGNQVYPATLNINIK
jgi:hypothetical protein